MPPRGNKQSLGNLVAQYFDVADPMGNTVDETSTKRLFGARYTAATDADGFPVLHTVDGTDGPINGMIAWTPKSPRVLSQLSFCFPAKITTASPLKATPVKSATSGTPTMETTLDEMEVSTLDGSSPSVGTFGLVVVGSDLFSQLPIFFQGGAGTQVGTYKVTASGGAGTYTLQQYTYKNGSTIGSPVAACEELNLAPAVPVNTWVFAIKEADGVIRFSLPLGC